MAIEIICGTLVVNTYILYNSVRPVKDQLSVLKIRESLIRSLLKINKKTKQTTNKEEKHSEEGAHKLEELPRGDDGKIYRKRCHGCYTKLRDTLSSKEACKKTKKVSTLCRQCNQAYCISCYAENHWFSIFFFVFFCCICRLSQVFITILRMFLLFFWPIFDELYLSYFVTE